MQTLKRIVAWLTIWILGVVLFSWWLLEHLKKNPIPANPDGSVPDSAGIPIANFALNFLILLAILIAIANIALWIRRRLFQKRRPV